MSQVPPAMAAVVDGRDELRCFKCRSRWTPGFDSRHHRLLRSRGVLHVPSNLVLLCGSGTTACHGWVHREVDAATRLGLIVPSWAKPSEWPILAAPNTLARLAFPAGWFTLDDLGAFTPITEADRVERMGVWAA